MNLSPNSSVFIIILVTCLWGSWFQAVKHIGKYPIISFISWMYTFSLVIVWVSILLLQTKMIPGGIANEIFQNIPLSVLLLGCGVVFALAMQLHLSVVGRIGLVLSTSISATCSILCGTIVSSFFGRIPEGASFTSIFFASILLVLATIICQYAGIVRDRKAGRMSAELKKSRIHDILSLVFINSVLLSSYPLATSVGIRSPLNPNGLSSLTCMGILVTGAFISSNVFTILTLTRKRQWRVFWHPDKKISIILFMAFIAACCHFGGNILHAIVAPVISVVIATAMGNSYHIWSYLWGIFYGEFRGANYKAYFLLTSGIIMFIIGVLVLSFNVV